MKSKKRSKRHKKGTPTHTKKKHKARRTPRAGQATHVAPSPTLAQPPTRISMVKTCDEMEVGDIGGFGSPDELEVHERRCGQDATEFCNTCGKNLCGNHYELLHRDHDATQGHTGANLTGQ